MCPLANVLPVQFNLFKEKKDGIAYSYTFYTNIQRYKSAISIYDSNCTTFYRKLAIKCKGVSLPTVSN